MPSVEMRMEGDQVVATFLYTGLQVKELTDEPGRVSERHAHGKVVLFTLDGSAILEREGRPPARMLPGVLAVIETGQIHQATAGEDGWEYIVGVDPVEAA